MTSLLLKSFSAFGSPRILFALYITPVTLRPPVTAPLGRGFPKRSISSSSAPIKAIPSVSVWSWEKTAIFNVKMILNQIDPNNLIVVIWLQMEPKAASPTAAKSCISKL